MRLVSLAKGGDLVEAVASATAEIGASAAWVQGIGALDGARLAWYDQAGCAYREMTVEGGLEILSLAGNVTTRQGRRFAHLHLTLSGPDGIALGGHALAGCRVFACELALWPHPTDVERSADPETGLWLWPSGLQRDQTS